MARNNTASEYGYIRGNLAFAPKFEVREQDDYEYERRREQRRREAEKPKARPRQKRRAAVRISPINAASFVLLAVAAFLVLLCFARLTVLSSEVSALNKEATLLSEESIKLKTEYEKSFDLASVKAAAEAAGMTKPSASQIYYIDMSGDDSVTVYQNEEVNVLSRIFTSFGHGIVSAVEYFR